MNLRILKKLSKRAAALLQSGVAPITRGSRVELFKATKWDDYTDTIGHDRKHWERSQSVHADAFHKGVIVLAPRHGKKWVHLDEPSHPRKGTMMVGWTSGWECPEWEEHTAWEELLQRVEDVFCEYREVKCDDGPFGCDYVPVWTRRFPNPSAVFRAVPDMLAECKRQEQERQRRWNRQEAAA